MQHSAIFAAALAMLAAPAAAVQVVGTSAGAGNSVSVLTQEPGRLELDFQFGSAVPARVDLLADTGETGFDFNAFIDLPLPEGATGLRIMLHGATFTSIGTVAPAFSFADITSTANRLDIRFRPTREFVSVALGNVFAGTDFSLAYTGSGPVGMRVSAIVPEPATWAMLILGFGAVGITLRRRRDGLSAL